MERPQTGPHSVVPAGPARAEQDRFGRFSDTPHPSRSFFLIVTVFEAPWSRPAGRSPGLSDDPLILDDGPFRPTLCDNPDVLAPGPADRAWAGIGAVGAERTR
jgi:hypothetical protein